MKKIILITLVLGTLSAALIGCGFDSAEPYLEKDGAVQNTRTSSSQ